MSPLAKLSGDNLKNIEANDYAMGMVIRTGFSTKKG